MCQLLLRLTDGETQRIQTPLLILTMILRRFSPIKKSKFRVLTHCLEILLWLLKKLRREHHSSADGSSRREYKTINKAISLSMLSQPISHH